MPIGPTTATELRLAAMRAEYLEKQAMGRTTREDYARHYRDYQGKPEQIKKRAQRGAARDEMEKKHGAAALKGKDVHHVKPIRSGGGNGKNLKLQSPSKNRGWK